MRSCLLLYLLISALSVTCQTAAASSLYDTFYRHANSYPDTLTLKHDFAIRPFITDTISVAAIKHLLGADFQIHKKCVPNKFISGQVDTLITIQKNQSFIRLYAVSKSDKVFYEQAEIKDPIPVFKNSIRIGQTKNEIRKCLPELGSTKNIPDMILIVDENDMDYLFLSFEEDKLQKVVFQPYLD